MKEMIDSVLQTSGTNVRGVAQGRAGGGERGWGSQAIMKVRQ
jgi:hypothetical protein